MEVGEFNYSLISSPYDSFMRKHLQHYGYFSGRGDVIRKYGFLPSNPQLVSSSNDSDSSSSEDEHGKDKGKSFVPEGRPIRAGRMPNGGFRGGLNDDSSLEPRWPIEIEVLNEPRIKHLNVSPLQPEYFYKPNPADRGPFARSFDGNNCQIVFNYVPDSCGYFIRSRIGGNRDGCRQAAVELQNSEDTTLLFESRFESGNLMKAVQVSKFDYELYLRYDLYTKRNTQWFYFRIQNARVDNRYRFTIVNFFKPTSLYSCGMRPLLYSVKDAENKGIGWRRWGEDIVYYKNNLSAPNNSSSCMYSLSWTCKFPNNNDTYYFAHCYPYTYSDLQDYLTEIQNDRFKSQYCKQKVLCRTLAGNFIYMLTITNPAIVNINNSSTSTENQIKKGVVVTARVHPGETNASWMMKGLLDFLLGDSLDAKLLRDNFIFKIIPMLNPDGVIVGNYRCSLSGRDLNRNYKTILKDAYPSIWHTREMIKRFMNETELILYCDFHGHSRKQNVFVYGCENLHLPNERFKERIFPAILSKNDPTKFSLYSSKFKVQKHKEGTGRVVMWSLGIKNSYTLEATFCGSTQLDRAGQHFNIADLESIGFHFLDSLLDYCDPDTTKRNQILKELEDNIRRSIQMKLLARGINPASIGEIDLDQYLSDDDSSDDVGSDSSADDGLPKHLEVIAAAKVRLTKTRKKPTSAKSTKDVKKKDEIDKENYEKNKNVGLTMIKTRNSQLATSVNDSTKPFPTTLTRRLNENNNDSVRFGSSNSINRLTRWPTLTTTQTPNGRLVTPDEKPRRTQAEHNKTFPRDTATSDNRENKQNVTDNQMTLTSSFFPTQQPPPPLENLPEEEFPIRYDSMPSCNTTDVHELTLTNDSRNGFTTAYLLRRIRTLERDSTINTGYVSSTTHQKIPSNSRLDEISNPQITTDTETDIETSRVTLCNQNDDGKHLTSSYVTNKLSVHLNERLTGASRSINRPKSTTIKNPLQNRTIFDVKSIAPPIEQTNQKRISDHQQHQRQRVMMVFGKQTNTDGTDKQNPTGGRTFHLSINERKFEEPSINQETSSNISRLFPIPTENISLNILARHDSTYSVRTQAIRTSSVKKTSK